MVDCGWFGTHMAGGVGVDVGVCCTCQLFCYSFKTENKTKTGENESNCIGIKCQTFYNLLDPIKQICSIAQMQYSKQ